VFYVVDSRDIVIAHSGFVVVTPPVGAYLTITPAATGVATTTQVTVVNGSVLTLSVAVPSVAYGDPWSMVQVPSDTSIQSDVIAALETALPGSPVAGSRDALLAQLSAIAAAVSSSPIQVNNLLDSGGQLWLESGDDYPSGLAIQFGVPTTFMSLTGSTPTLDITPVLGGVPSATPVLTITGTILTGTYTINGVNYSTVLQFTPTAAQTAKLTNWSPQAYSYRVRCVFTSPVQTIGVVPPSPCTALW
jgi:hypothetical protein